MAWKTALVYAVLAGLWIAVSDRLVVAFTSDPATIETISTLKGWFFVLVTAALLYWSLRRHFEALNRDARERRRIEELNEDHQRILEMIAKGVPVSATLHALVELVETRDPEMICSILLLDRDGRHLRHGAAGRLPDEYVAAIDGVEIGPGVGSCGTAAFRAERVIVADIEHDPLWAGFSEIAMRHDLRACWSTPIIDGEGRVLGTFAVYYKNVRSPEERQIRVIDQATYAAALCLSRNRAEAALRESEERFRTLVEQASDACYVCDTSGRLIDVNRRACKVLGYDHTELLALRVTDIDVGMDVAASAKLRDRLSPGDIVTINSRHRRKDGSSFPVEVNISCCLLGGQKVLLGLARDTTEREKAEAALRSSEAHLREAQERLQSALETGGIGTFVVDFTKNETFWDESLVQLYGRTWDPADGASPVAFARIVHPEDRERVLDDMASASHREVSPQTEYRILRPDGSVRWVATSARGELDADGTPRRLIGATIDITAHKETEERLRQAQKLEAIGQLAGGVAHDFNNILTVIQAGVSFLELEETLSRSAREFVSEIKGAATRAANLTRQLLTFSRRQAMQLRHVDLNEVVANMSRILHRVLGEQVKVDLRLASNALPVFGDAGMLEQIVMNLSLNARDAMPDGGRLTITTRPVEIAASMAPVGAGGRSGAFVCMEAADTGVGITGAVLPHIFEPFFTTKETGRGTGLGLATVQGIVEQHGGWVEVQSELGLGTSFRIFLPRLDATAPSRVGPVPRRKLDRGSETILLVEDEAVVRALVRNLLKHSGYRVLEAPSGPRAIDQWNSSGREVDLLITDLVMPDGMSGFDLAERLRRDKPDLPVIFTSGYSPEFAGLGEELREGVNFLAKPFDLENLNSTVRTALDLFGQEGRRVSELAAGKRPA